MTGTAPRAGHKAQFRPEVFGRHSSFIVALLHGGLALFFFMAGWAKLTEPLHLLSLLMAWPGHTSPSVVYVIGAAEMALATAVAAPLLRDWRGRLCALRAAIMLSASATAMMIYHVVRNDHGLATTNLMLVLIGVAIVIGQRPRRP